MANSEVLKQLRKNLVQADNELCEAMYSGIIEESVPMYDEVFNLQQMVAKLTYKINNLIENLEVSK